MGLDARNAYLISNPASSLQQTEVVPPAVTGNLTGIQTLTVEELVRFKKEKNDIANNPHFHSSS